MTIMTIHVFQPIVDKFNKEQDAFIKSQGGSGSGQCPWVGHKAEEKIKDEIMALSAVSQIRFSQLVLNFRSSY